MVVMILERVNRRLRGELTRWLIEPHAGVYVGHVNAMVRDRLWEKCCEASDVGGVIQIWNSNNEQRVFPTRVGVNRRHEMNTIYETPFSPHAWG